jgi:hypothetical protein
MTLELGEVKACVPKETFPELLEFLLTTFVPTGEIPTPLPATYHAKPKFGMSMSVIPRQKILVDTHLKFNISGFEIWLKVKGNSIAKIM